MVLSGASEALFEANLVALVVILLVPQIAIAYAILPHLENFLRKRMHRQGDGNPKVPR